MSSNLSAIKTCNSLVFFDLETTGLPAYHSPKITELSFCAVERNQFLNGQPKEIPRVTNRLNLCIYPSRLVDPEATNKTKLDNYNLEHQSRFDEDVFSVIFSFLNRLKRPICLIAHNGFNFDFPILRSEIAKLGKVSISISFFVLLELFIIISLLITFLFARNYQKTFFARIPFVFFVNCSVLPQRAKL